jgi:hypothetical protein
MKFTYLKVPAFLFGGIAFCVPGASQVPDHALTARELYYVPYSDAPSQKTAITVKSKPKARPEANSSSTKEQPSNRDQQANKAAPASADLLRVSDQIVAPLGLRYTVQKQVKGDWRSVDAATVFHAGDRIRLSIEVNDDGFLYIIHQGATGAWIPMYPGRAEVKGSNRISKNQPKVVPQGSAFKFDEIAGNEKLFLVVSRQPEPSLEELMRVLQGGSSGAPGARPTSDNTLMASRDSSISDAAVGQFRQTYARDLVIEQVTEPQDAAKGTEVKEVYVVNPRRAKDARVVADISLIHR